ncbi:autotransporter-associated beta strand repeat-containing protein [Prosthecobacter sp. SYSU 5D2]|uniref:beta strand repeat-containing protein n=1 Tax=Prosthecobacter sp. SYSU 5D2 TaxID=3134134 RepID=UPI0031FEDADA
MRTTTLTEAHGRAVRLSRPFRILTALASVIALSMPVAYSQSSSLQWDANGTGPAVTDGPGTWNTTLTNTNWWNGSTNVAWDNDANNIAIFGNGGDLGTTVGGATVSVSGTVNAGGLRFNSIIVGTTQRGYILNGGTVALSDGAFIRMENSTSNSGGNSRLVFNNSFAGSNISFQKEGNDSAFITLSGTNTWTGTLALASGGGGIFFNVTNINAVSSLGAFEVQSGNTLVINHTQTDAWNVPLLLTGTGNGSRGSIRFDRDRTLAGEITLTGNTAISTNSGTTALTGTLAGNIGESGGSRTLTINTVSASTGTILLSGENTFTGGLVINRGTLRIGSTGALNRDAPNLLTFANTTDNKFVTLDGYSVSAGGLNTLGVSDTVTVQNTSLTAATLTIQNTDTQTFRGTLTDGTGGGALSLVKTGSGTQILTRASTYTGSTTLTEGTLQLDFSAPGAPASNIGSASSALTMNGGTLSITGGSSAANSQTFNGLTVAEGASTISLLTNVTPQNLVLNLGTITSQSNGTINFILPSGAQSATNGIRTTSANEASGILGGWATVNGTDWATVQDGNIVAYTDYDLVTNFGTGAGAIGPLPNDATANVKIVDGGTSGNIALGNPGGMTDVNTLIQSATGDAVIGSASGDTLRLGTYGGIVLAAGAGDLTIGAAANNGSQLTAGGAVSGTAGQLLFSDQEAGQTTTVNSDINDNGAGGTVSLSKNGPGLLVLTGTSSNYSGGTYLNGGIIRIGGDNRLGAVPANVDVDNLTFNGGTLELTTSFNLNSNRGITLEEGGGSIDTRTFNTTYDGVISGPGSLTKITTYPPGTQATAVSGTLTLTNANTYTGETIVQSGILLVNHNEALGSTAAGTQVGTNGIVRLADGIVVTGETLTITGPGNNAGNLQVHGGTAEWAGNIILGTDSGRIGTNSGTGTLIVSGVIQDGAGSKLSINGNAGGTVVLTANNTYTGITEMVRGFLRLGTDQALSSQTVLSLLTNPIVTETVAVDLYGFDQTVAGIRHGVTSNVDNLEITNSQAGEESTLTIDQSANYTYNGKITGNLGIIKDGSGVLTLTNTYNSATPTASVSTYTGNTIVRGGTLALSGTGNLTGTPWIQVDEGATFSISGRTSGDYTINNQVLSGRGTVNGQLILTGSSYLTPGDSTGLLADAGYGTGELTFNNVSLTGGTPTLRALFQLGGTNSQLADILSGDAAEFADASSGGLYDSLQVNGTLGLNAGATLRVELLDSYEPELGDVFNLLDWGFLEVDADGANGAGAWTLADLDLSAANAALGNGWFFETDQFLQHGIIYVAIPEPSRMLFLVLGVMAVFGRRRRTQLL